MKCSKPVFITISHVTRAESYDQGDQMVLCPALVSTMHTGPTTGVSSKLHNCITTLTNSAKCVLLPTLEIATIDNAIVIQEK